MIPNPFREVRRLVEGILFTIIFIIILLIFGCTTTGCSFRTPENEGKEEREESFVEEIEVEEILLEEILVEEIVVE